MIAQGRKKLSASAAGSRIRSLLRSEPIAILRDDRQFAVGGEADHVARRDRRVVDHDAGGLGAGLGGLARDVVERGRRHLGERGDVVEKGDQSDSHGYPRRTLQASAVSSVCLSARDHSKPGQFGDHFFRHLVRCAGLGVQMHFRMFRRLVG